MANLPKQIARAIAARSGNDQNTAVIYDTYPGSGFCTVMIKGAGWEVRHVSTYTPVVNDVVVLRRDRLGILIIGRIGVHVPGDESEVTSNAPFQVPRLQCAPVFTGTWRDGRWVDDTGNDPVFGRRVGVDSIGVAYYGRGLQGLHVFASDSGWLGTIRLPSPGNQPPSVRLSLLGEQRPEISGPTVLDFVDVPLTGAAMGLKVDDLHFDSLGWWDAFDDGSAGGLALQRVPANPDHLIRVASNLGLSMTVTGHPAWIL